MAREGVPQIGNTHGRRRARQYQSRGSGLAKLSDSRVGIELERPFGEERRTKVIPHAFGERVVLTLMYAALIRAAER